MRRDDRAGVEALAAFESRLRARARVVLARRRGAGLDLAVTGRLRRAGKRAIAVTRSGERLRWEPPPELAPSVGYDDRDVTEALDGQVGIVLRSQLDETEWSLTVASTTHVPVADGPVFPRVKGRVRIDPGHAAGGGPLPPGRYDVLVTLSIAGFAAETEAREDGAPFTITVPLARPRLTARIARMLRGHTRWP